MLLCAACVLCLCSCDEQERQNVVTLSVMTVLGDDDILPIYSQALSELTVEDELLTIKDVTVRWADAYKLKLLEQETYEGADAPDVICVSSDLFADSPLLENFISVNEIRADYPQFVQHTLPSALDSVRAGDGLSYCVPLYGEYECVIVNTRLLLSYGSPEALNEYPLLIEALTALCADGLLPVANAPEDCVGLLESLVLALGGGDALQQGAGRDEQVLADVWSRAFDVYADMCCAPVSASDVGRADPVEVFTSGNAALLLCSGKTAAAIADKGDYSVFALPQQADDSADKRCVYADFSVGFYITEKAYSDPERFAAVVKYIECMTGSKVGESLMRLGLLSSCSDVSGTSDGSLCEQMQALAADAESFCFAADDAVLRADAANRLREVSQGLSGNEAAGLMLTPGAAFNDITVQTDDEAARTDITNVQTP